MTFSPAETLRRHAFKLRSMADYNQHREAKCREEADRFRDDARTEAESAAEFEAQAIKLGAQRLPRVGDKMRTRVGLRTIEVTAFENGPNLRVIGRPVGGIDLDPEAHELETLEFVDA